MRTKSNVVKVGTKVCLRCKKSLPATREYFGAYRPAKDGLIPYCHKCHRELGTIYRKTFKEKHVLKGNGNKQEVQ
jgi:NAD-dependent SIR2 family protein deacetylase